MPLASKKARILTAMMSSKRTPKIGVSTYSHLLELPNVLLLEKVYGEPTPFNATQIEKLVVLDELPQLECGRALILEGACELEKLV